MKPTARERRIAALRQLAATGEYGLPRGQFAGLIPAYPEATIRALVTNGLIQHRARYTATDKGRRLLADIDARQREAS